MKKEECFAYDKGNCNILTIGRCQTPCNFQKTQEEVREGERKAHDRLRTLDGATRLAIAGAYFKGREHLL